MIDCNPFDGVLFLCFTLIFIFFFLIIENYNVLLFSHIFRNISNGFISFSIHNKLNSECCLSSTLLGIKLILHVHMVGLRSTDMS